MDHVGPRCWHSGHPHDSPAPAGPQVLLCNSDMLDRTVHTHNWIRAGSIFIGNEQIEAVSNRPPWIAAICEAGTGTGDPKRLGIDESVTRNERTIGHVMDVGANYWSLWNWHHEAARNILSYYEKYPEPVEHIARRIGYRVRPSWIWSFERDGVPGLVMGFFNNGIAAMPGVLRAKGVRHPVKSWVTTQAMPLRPWQSRE